jgi:serine/threonine-protein kinase
MPFAAEPALAENLQQLNRHAAACSAVFAGTGRSADGAALDAAAQARLRRQGRDWLRADLGSLAKVLATGPAPARVFVRNQLRHWLRDPDLAGVRDPAELLALPTEERLAWLALWDDVAVLRQKVPE